MGEHMQDYELTEKQARPTFGKGLIFIVVLIAIVAVLGMFVLQYRSS